MPITKTKLNQLETSTTVGSITSTNGSNVLSYVAPLAQDHLWGYEFSTTSAVAVIIGTNLSYNAATNTLSATAGAGGYVEIQEEGAVVGASNTKINFVGSGLTAANAGTGVTSVTVAAFLNTLATAGSVSLTANVAGILPVANGGTGIASGTSGGILAFTATGTIASSALLTANALVMGGGAGVAPSTPLGLGTTTTVLHGNAAGAPTWGSVSLTADISGILAGSNGGTGTGSYAIGDILYADSTSSLARRAAVATGSVLKSAGVSTAPVWGTLASTELSDTAGIMYLAGTQTVSGAKTFTNNITINGTPSATTDAATVGYVQTYVNGLDPKASVRAATTVAGTLASSFANTSVIDGITLATGDRILIKNQAAPAENGIYTVNATGTPTRSTDMDSWLEVPSSFLFVELGTINADSGWVCTSDQGGTLNTTAITFVRFASNVSNISGSGAVNKVAYWSAVDTLTSTTNFHFNGTQLAIGTASPVTNVMSTTQGTGTTNTTFGLQHNNSSAVQVFRVADDGTTVIGTGTTITLTGTTIAGSGAVSLNASGSVTIGPSSSSNVNINNGSGGTFSYGAGYTWTSAAGTLIAGSTSSLFLPTSGTATFSSFSVTPSVNQTGGANGISRGIHINPSITAAFDYRGLEITTPVAHYALWTTAGKVRHDLGSDANFDTYYRGTTGEFIRLANGTTGQVLTATTSAAPSWAASAGGTVTVCYVTGTGTATYDLDAGVVAKDVDGTAFVFTVPANLDSVDVYRNGIMLSRTGTVSRDYTLNSGTGVLVLSSVLATDEELKIMKRV